MNENEQPQDGQELTSKQFLFRKLRPLLITMAGLFLFSAVILPICIAFHADVALYIIAALLAIGIFAGGYFAIHLANTYADQLENSFQAMGEQLDDFSHGDIKLLSLHHYLPTIDKIQERLNSAISRYSEYRLVYVNQPKDAALKEKIAKGEILSWDDFTEHFYKEVQNNVSYRSALLFIQSLGTDASSSKVMNALHEKILLSFPGAIVGQYDEKTFGIYDYSVDSFLSFETLCQQFVASYNQFKVSPYDDLTSICYCKLGAVIYPYTPLINLLEEGLAALSESKDVSIRTGVRSVYYPHAILSENNKRVIYLASIENFERSFGEAKTSAEQLSSLKDFARWFAVSNDFEVGGLMVYRREMKTYEIVMETGKEPKDKSFSRLGTSVPEKDVDPFYEAAAKDLSFSTASVDELPSEMSKYLNNIDVKSFYFAALTYEGEKRGFLYFTSSSKRPYFALLSRENLNRYTAMASSYILTLDCQAESDDAKQLLESLANKAGKYLYSIDKKSYVLTYLSEGMKKMFPEAKVGDICYRDLRSDHTAPCSHCPLKGGADHRIINRISATESTVTTLQYHGVHNDNATILIEASTQDDTAVGGSHLLDENLSIKNMQGLTLDLSHQIKLGSVGYIVAVRLLDTDAILEKAPGSDSNAIMASVCKAVQDAGYGDLLYRCGEYEIAFLLKSYTKPKIMDFVEEISDLMRGPLEVRYIPFTPSYAFCAISYPTDAPTTREALSLIDGELTRSQTFGPGYLVEVASRHPRKALRDDYIVDLLKATLVSEEMPIAMQPIFDAAGSKIVAADVLARLYGTDGAPIPPGEFIPLAQAQKMAPQVDIGAFRSAGKLYEHYAFSFFKSAGIAGLSIYLSAGTIKDPHFAEEAKRIYSRYQFPTGYVFFEVNVADVVPCQADLTKLMAATKDLGIIYEVVDYHPEILPLEELRNLGISHFKTERALIREAVSTPNDYASFSRFIDAALRSGFTITCAGIENKEEKELAQHMQIPYLQGNLFAKALPEKDFISLITYGK
jgi:EAL domain-containing protein (putative c-di-GMP-specific phosphodiesterase class I)